MTRRRTVLTIQPADPDELPLGFEMGEHLSGRRRAFRDVDTGERQAGKLLNDSLGSFGVQPKVISVSGKFRPYGAEPEDLRDWTQHATVAGTLDYRTLGYIAHGLARRRSERAGTDGTAPEVYITEVTISEAPPPKKRRRDKRGRFLPDKPKRKPKRKPSPKKRHAGKRKQPSTRKPTRGSRKAPNKTLAKARRSKGKRHRKRN